MSARRAPPAFLLALCLLLSAPVAALAESAAAAPSAATPAAKAAPQGAAPAAKAAASPPAAADLGDARSRLAKASSPAEYKNLLSAFAASLPPSDALALLAEFVPKLPEAERSPFLVQAGDLSLLLGLFAEASERYAEASALAKGGRDGLLLLRSARCALASGEAERASALSSDILIAGPEPALAAQARLVGAWALLLQGKQGDARAVASALSQAPASNGASGDARCEARFILWLIAGRSGDKAEQAALAASLAADFPGSPEALFAAGSVSAPPLPHWYLGPLGEALGRDGASSAKLSTKPSGAAAPAASPAAADSPAAPAMSRPEPASGSAAKPAASTQTAVAAKGRRLQLGYFSVEDNAEALRAELAAKGFAAAIEEQTKQDKSGAAAKRWIVTVAPGSDLAKTMQRLKDSGYEAYVIE